MGKYIIILEANPKGYAVDTTLTASNRLANDLIDAGQAKEIDEPIRPSKAEDTPIIPHINVSVPDTKIKRDVTIHYVKSANAKAGRTPNTSKRKILNHH